MEPNGQENSVAAVADAKYVLLTTFRRSGEGVSTPVWAAADGDAMLVWTEANAGKIKRIRNDQRVTVQKCDARGKKTSGPVVDGTATILDAAGTEHARTLIIRKYGIVGRLIVQASKLRRGSDGTVAVRITTLTQ